MKNKIKKQQIIRRCQAMALAGFISAGTWLPSFTALAAGPGDPGNTVTSQVSSGGPGNSGNSGNSAGNQNGAASQRSQENPNAWKKVNGVYQMPDGSAIDRVLFRGIDVSRWQGEIDWNQVAADDVSFVMLGTRSKGAVDPYFHRNIQQASAAGVKVGVYIYSLAMTPEMAVQEADFVLDLIHDYPVSYPVAFDMEDSTQGSLSKDELAAIANAFCRRISDAGYYPIIYANDNWLANKLDMSKMDYPVWVARYSNRPAYPNPVMWQASSTGAVNGINGNVDIDFQFKDFTSVIPANTWRTIGGSTYYYQNYVKQKNAWIQDEGSWYYMDGNGLASRGWITLSGQSYYLDENTGKMATGWKSDGGKWYYLGSSGAVASGWINDNGTWYYSSKEGVMQTGWLEESGRRYFLNDNGAMAVGWTSQNGKWYYLSPSGALSTGWINDNGTWYYSNGEGIMQTGWIEEGGRKYYLKGSGAIATGWRQMDGAWYYFEGSGAMAVGMVQVNGFSYYLDPSTGQMAADTEVNIDGVRYQADGNGVLSQIQDSAGQTEAGASPQGQAELPAQPQGNAGEDNGQASGNGQAGQSQELAQPNHSGPSTTSDPSHGVSTEAPGETQGKNSSGGPGV